MLTKPADYDRCEGIVRKYTAKSETVVETVKERPRTSTRAGGAVARIRRGVHQSLTTSEQPEPMDALAAAGDIVVMRRDLLRLNKPSKEIDGLQNLPGLFKVLCKRTEKQHNAEFLGDWPSKSISTLVERRAFETTCLVLPLLAAGRKKAMMLWSSHLALKKTEWGRPGIQTDNAAAGPNSSESCARPYTMNRVHDVYAHDMSYAASIIVINAALCLWQSGKRINRPLKRLSSTKRRREENGDYVEEEDAGDDIRESSREAKRQKRQRLP
ncbi:hypothetical protein B0H11DRAFT_1921216 [Mycena galericulata]|nr:hypothetical protein B0H11DRAFT_1921216 [Mycena galericulata]